MLALCLRCDSIGKVQSKLDYLRLLLSDQVAFKSIYRYAYDFARVNTSSFIQVKHLAVRVKQLSFDIFDSTTSLHFTGEISL
jgi:hypothetical protein